jgi:hypothetical protein
MTKYQIVEILYTRNPIEITPILPMCESREEASESLHSFVRSKIASGETDVHDQGGDVYFIGDKQWRILEVTDLPTRYPKPFTLRRD